MSFSSKASHIFPKASWTGQSHIHVSIARGGELPYGMSDTMTLMTAIQNSNLSAYIFRVIEKNCPGMEWLMPPEAFSDLIKVDLYHLINGKATTVTKKRLQNPTTGNYFHRITMMEEHQIVGGVRVWLTPISHDATHFGFRFRLESQEQEAKKVRKHAEELVAQLEPEVHEIKEYVKGNVIEMPMVLEDYLEV